MELHIRDNKLRKALETEASRRHRFGADTAKKLEVRLKLLQAAESLADLWPPKRLPERCHELEGQRKGTFSIDLKHPYRLLFKEFGAPSHDSPDDEQARWKAITSIEILGIEDTHG